MQFQFHKYILQAFSTFGVKEFVPISYAKRHAVLRGLLGSLSKSKMLHLCHSSLFDPPPVTSFFLLMFLPPTLFNIYYILQKMCLNDTQVLVRVLQSHVF